MNLREKLSGINKNALPKMDEGYAEDVRTFWHGFVEPRLPEKEAVLAWHELLMHYVQDDGAVFVIRAFSNTNTTPRRGLLTKTDRGFSFTYADNGFAKLIAKMAMDGFCPEYEEFKEAMLAGKIPVSEFMGSEEKQRALCKQQVKADYAGYKLAHIVDSGKGFFMDGLNCGLTEIYRKHFPAGALDDWKIEGNIYVRNLPVTSEARDILSAHFLRYVDPLNYFLSPKPQNKGIAFHTLGINIPNNDIAEYKPLQLYAMRQFYGKFGQVYKDFLNLLKIPPVLLNQFECENDFGDAVIKIHYGKTEIGIAPKRKIEMPTNVVTSRNCPPRMSYKTKMATDIAEYSATRLTFKRDEIERLSSSGLIIIHTPEGTFEMKKSDFYATFHSVVVSESYQKNGIYHYPKTPEKAYKFHKKVITQKSK